MGEAVCPISISKTVFDAETLSITKKITEVSGRKISLLKIRKDHLKFMERKGLLRKTDPELMSLNDLQNHLTKNKGTRLLNERLSLVGIVLILSTSFRQKNTMMSREAKAFACNSAKFDHQLEIR